ncbi:hypothetical protein [Methylobacterium crusticola]|uniref:hypothetical protein n=1 Tax=Methylobacterium crusticola TaxID=1697972 RepID=UPI000FFB99A1|nr:hypothetical protein [Methylobacterium crusticola]
MAKGMYKAGIDFPFVIMSGSAPRVSVRFMAKEADDTPAIALKFLFGFISGKDPTNTIWLPENVGDGMFETANGIIQLNTIELWTEGSFRIVAFANNFMVAQGICDYKLTAKSKDLKFSAKRNSPGSVTESNADSTSTAEGRTTVTGTASYAPGGIGVSGSVGVSGPETTKGSTATKGSTRPVAGAGFDLRQVV